MSVPCILLADDNADMRDYVRVCSPRAMRSWRSPTAKLRSRLIARRKPDFVLTDIMMPSLDGMQLLARLRAAPQTSALPIIMLSARAGEESRVEGMHRRRR